MNPYDGVKYGRIGYTGILRSDFTTIWSDAPVLFRRINALRSVLAAKALSDKLLISFNHCFTYNHIRYCAVFTPMYDNNYICRIYPEDFFIKSAFSEMYDYIRSIKTRSLTAVMETKEYFEENFDRLTETGLDGFVESQINFHEEIFTDASNVLNMFDKSHMCEYVPIVKNLEHTYNHIKLYNEECKKNIILDLCIFWPVAKINYTVLESALFLMARIFYMVMAENDSLTLKIKNRENSRLVFTSSYDISVPFDERKINRIIKLLRCSLSEIGGSIRLNICKEKLDLKCVVPTTLSKYMCRVGKIDKRPVCRNDMFELRGIDDVFDSYEKNFIGFRSPKTEPNIDISCLLAEITLGEFIA